LDNSHKLAISKYSFQLKKEGLPEAFFFGEKINFYGIVF